MNYTVTNNITMFPGFQREDRLILKETKVWIEQFERDLTRAQMTESNLQDKYQVSVISDSSVLSTTQNKKTKSLFSKTF